MTAHSPTELFARHGITYIVTRSGKFTADCPNCGAGYLNCESKKDGVVWFCHQCEFNGGEKFEQRQQSKPTDTGLGPIRAVFDYTDETGKLLFQVMRFEPVGRPKEFRQRTGPDQDKWSIKGVRIVPFRLPELIADLDRVVFVVEGEKDVNTLRAQGVPATCNPMGAGKWWPEFNKIFRDADVIVCGDNDEPGKRHVELVCTNLAPVCKRLRVLNLADFWPDIENGDDVSDWLAGHTVDLLWQIVGDLPDYKPTTNGNGEHKGETPSAPLDILSREQFLAGFVPPDYLVHGILQRRFFYSLTGQTGHAKTAVALLMAQLVSCVDRNAMLGSFHVAKGRVIYFAGENPDDLRMRVIGSGAVRTDNPEADNLWFIPGVFNIPGMMHVLKEDCRAHGDVSLIIVDTSAAYFLGNDEISNPQMGAYARALRELTTLPGGPCVLVLCHPVKHTEDQTQLLPRGGGAYLAEVDGNLTLWKRTDDLVELSYTKMRGPGFQPITFRLDTIRTAKLTDGAGKMLPTVQAVAIAQSEEEKLASKAENDEDRLLVAMLREPNGTQSTWAEACGWMESGGAPHKVKVFRMLQKLSSKVHPRLVIQKRNKWVLTDDGKVIAREAALRFEREAEDRSQERMF